VYVNFGFWDVVQDTGAARAGHYNRKIERRSRSSRSEIAVLRFLLSEEEFWRLTTGPRTRPQGALRPAGGSSGNLYEKCVLGK